MIFFKLLGKAFSSLTLAWVRDKKNNTKPFVFRILVFTFSFLFLCVWTPIWYYKAYLPYEDIEYPKLSEMRVDSGIFKTVKKGDVLITSDGRKIVLGGIYQYIDYQRKHRVQGSIDLPVFFVKVWWFPMTHVQRGWIGQMEIDGKSIATYEEKSQDFLRQKDHSKFYGVVKKIGVR